MSGIPTSAIAGNMAATLLVTGLILAACLIVAALAAVQFAAWLIEEHRHERAQRTMRRVEGR